MRRPRVQLACAPLLVQLVSMTASAQMGDRPLSDPSGDAASVEANPQDEHSVELQAVEAETQFEQGKSLLQRGDYAHACALLLASYRSQPATGALLAAAMCHEHEGKLATAYQEYLRAAERSRVQGYQDRERAARDQAMLLEDQLSTLVIESAAATPGLAFRLNGVLLEPSQLGKAMPVDGGQQVIEAEAPDKLPYRATLEVRPSGDVVRVVIPELDDRSAPAHVMTRPPPPRPSPPPGEPVVARSTHRPVGPRDEAGPSGEAWVGIGAMALGAIGLGVGTVFAIREATDDGPSDNCDGCDADDGDYAAMGFVIGGSLATIGLATYLLARRSGDADRAGTDRFTATASVWVLPGAGGASLRGRF